MTSTAPDGKSGAASATRVNRMLAWLASMADIVIEDHAWRVVVKGVPASRMLLLRFSTPFGELGAAPGLIDRRQPVWPDSERSIDLPAAIAALGRLEPVFAALETPFGGRLDPVGFGPVEGRSFQIELVDTDGDAAYRLELHVPEGTLAQLPAPPAPTPDRLAALPGPMTVIITGARLRPADLRDIAPGALLLMPRSGTQLVAAALVPPDDRLALLERPGLFDLDTGEFHVMEGNVEEEEEERLTALDAVPIALGMRLPAVSLSLGEIAALRPGTLLALAAPLEGTPIRLEIQGRLVARGEYVRIADMSAVRVTEVVGYGPPC